VRPCNVAERQETGSMIAGYFAAGPNSLLKAL
jgi:hypothetical protein